MAVIPEHRKCDRHVAGDPACQGEVRPRGYYRYDNHEGGGDPTSIEGVESDDLCEAAHKAVMDGVCQLTKKLSKKVRVVRPKQPKPTADGTKKAEATG